VFVVWGGVAPAVEDGDIGVFGLSVPFFDDVVDEAQFPGEQFFYGCVIDFAVAAFFQAAEFVWGEQVVPPEDLDVFAEAGGAEGV
jgi:hypothetical protein